MVGRPVMRVVVAEGHGGEERERKERKIAETRKMAVFLADFGPDFLLHQVTNGAYIYRRWKRVISSTPG